MTIIFGWMREDGTVSWDRDEIIGNVRRVVQGFKNSKAFIKQLDAQWDEEWKRSRPKRR